MGRAIDLSGERFGRLTVLQKAKSRNGQARWICKCDCGKLISVFGHSLRSGNTKSCGCLQRDIARNRLERPWTQEKSAKRVHKIWENMKRRCYDKNDISYKNYGGRGIIVCDEWKDDFLSFYKWAIKHGYKDELTLDRVDVNGPYSPDNCHWSSMKEQQNNRRNNTVIECFGEAHTLQQWADILGINRSTISSRIRYGWPIEMALTKSHREE